MEDVVVRARSLVESYDAILLAELPRGIEIFDAHTHLGLDIDGMRGERDELLRIQRAHGITCSMSRVGDCYDNALAESFFGTLKAELVHGQRWTSRRVARLAIFEWIEVFYNRQRRHSALGYVSPARFEAGRSKPLVA